MFDDVDERRKRRRRRKTKTSIEKEQKKKKKYFKTNVLVPKTTVIRKEEGATVGVCRPFCSLPSLSGLTRLSFVGSKAVSTEEVQTIGKYS
jgi:hypothetical protein